MSKAPLTVCITGAAGQIGYALLPHICSGKTFGPDQPVKLHLLDLNIEGVQTALGGVRMELEDSTYPLLKGVVTTGDAKVIYCDMFFCISHPHLADVQPRFTLFAINHDLLCSSTLASRRWPRKTVPVSTHCRF